MISTPPELPDLPVVAAPPHPVSGLRDFDFLHGRWSIRNFRLGRPLTGSSDWFAFDGSSVERPVWNGQGNLEEYSATLPDGRTLRGLALRLYDPNLMQWSIHWSNADSGRLDAPMVGTFRDGVGVFHGQEVYESRAILVRFRWTHSGTDQARWEQAFSADVGETWEINWIMHFTRE